MSEEQTARFTTNTGEALEWGRAALDAMVNHWELENPTDDEIDSYFDAVGDLFDAFVSLDAALSRGGPLPAEWSPDPEENLERCSRYAIKHKADAAIERHRSRGRLRLVTPASEPVEELGGDVVAEEAPEGAERE